MKKTNPMSGIGEDFQKELADLKELAATVAQSKGFPIRLRMLRKDRGLSMRVLAKQIRITQPTITAYEHGESFPPLPVAERLAFALGVNVCWLAYGVGRKSPLAFTSIPASVGVSP